MQITCPKCAARFLVESAAIGVDGRPVRCGKCRHEWIALPTLEVPLPEPVEAPPPRPEPVIVPTMPKAPPAIRVPKARRVSMGMMVGWVVLGIVVLGLIGAILQRRALVAEFPSLSGYFAMVGLGPAVVAPGDGLVLEDLASSRSSQEGTAVLLVEGRIVNTARDARDVPTLRGSLRDSSDREVQAWTFDVPNRRLARGESTKFKTEIRNPPPAGTDLAITFVNP